MKRIVFTVTNDLSYDQRMQRICTSLAKAGYSVLLVGRKMHDSKQQDAKAYDQKRLHCFFKKTLLFYAEYNLKLFFYLLFLKADAICAIDLDTILPCYLVSVIRRKKRIYDAHELFTEMKEVISRPVIKNAWMKIEKFAVPKYKFGYTVSQSIAGEFKKRYNADYELIQNVPVKTPMTISDKAEKFILYQGAVNEARGLENLILAMKKVEIPLHIYGDGNIYDKIQLMIKKENLEKKVFLKGKVLPSKLPEITNQAYIGINLVEPYGLNQLYSLANKFFDYIQAKLPQVTMNFPEYKRINDECEVAILINNTNIHEIANALNILLHDEMIYSNLSKNCSVARQLYNWEKEEKKLLIFYEKVFAE